jgi:hypothetical protein
MAKLTSRKLAYNGSDELRACLRVRGAEGSGAVEEDVEGLFEGGEVRDESSSTSASYVRAIQTWSQTVFNSKFLIDEPLVGKLRKKWCDEIHLSVNDNETFDRLTLSRSMHDGLAVDYGLLPNSQ